MAARKQKLAGAELADDLWEQLENLIPEERHEEAAAVIKEIFEDHDATDMDDSIVSQIAGGGSIEDDDDEDEDDEDESEEDEEDEDDE